LSKLRQYGAPILVGLAVAAAGLVPWSPLAALNSTHRPDIPWAALAMSAYLVALVAWLNGAGPPRSHSAQRARTLRLWPPVPRDDDGIGAGPIVALLILLYLFYFLIGRQSPSPDLGEYPTTAFRWSAFLMGGIMAGVVEEVAFRGYLQGGLERHDRANAVWITSLVFVLAHVTQGVGAMLMLAPGLFAASMLYGLLARRTGTILPGMIIHVLGDLAHVFFGPLRGDAGRLFVGA
jgi:membrane protease YdiL (CAAX protease family)